jgi:hypothetical protein
MSSMMKIHSEVLALLHAYGQTDRRADGGCDFNSTPQGFERAKKRMPYRHAALKKFDKGNVH